MSAGSDAWPDLVARLQAIQPDYSTPAHAQVFEACQRWATACQVADRGSISVQAPGYTGATATELLAEGWAKASQAITWFASPDGSQELEAGTDPLAGYGGSTTGLQVLYAQAQDYVNRDAPAQAALADAAAQSDAVTVAHVEAFNNGTATDAEGLTAAGELEENAPAVQAAADIAAGVDPSVAASNYNKAVVVQEGGKVAAATTKVVGETVASVAAGAAKGAFSSGTAAAGSLILLGLGLVAIVAVGAYFVIGPKAVVAAVTGAAK